MVPLMASISFADDCRSASPEVLQLVDRLKKIDNLAGTYEDVIGSDVTFVEDFINLSSVNGKPQKGVSETIISCLNTKSQLAMFLNQLWQVPTNKIYGPYNVLETALNSSLAKSNSHSTRDFNPNFQYFSNRYASFLNSGYLSRSDVQRAIVDTLYFWTLDVGSPTNEMALGTRLKISKILSNIVNSKVSSLIAVEKAINLSTSFPLSKKDLITALSRYKKPESSQDYFVDIPLALAISLKDGYKEIGSLEKITFLYVARFLSTRAIQEHIIDDQISELAANVSYLDKKTAYLKARWLYLKF